MPSLVFCWQVGELYGLVKFLKMDPWAYYCCGQKDCDCKFASWPFGRGKNRTCAHCGHRSFFHFSYFNRNIIKPISSNVRRHNIAAVWVAFFSRWQRYCR